MQLNVIIITTRFNYSLSSAWINSFIPHINYVRQVLSPLSRWRSWGIEMLYNLFKFIQLLSHRAELPVQAICDFNHCTMAASPCATASSPTLLNLCWWQGGLSACPNQLGAMTGESKMEQESWKCSNSYHFSDSLTIFVTLSGNWFLGTSCMVERPQTWV